MRADGGAEIQHWVPQLLLRLHATDPLAKKGSEQVWCFDKSDDKIFPCNIRGILGERRFYELEINDVVANLEPPITAIEDRAAPVLTRIVETRTLTLNSVADCEAIAEFCAIQFVRTQAARAQIRSLNEGLTAALQKRGIDVSQLSELKETSDEAIKSLSLQMLAEAPQVFAPHFLSKFWYLIEGRDDDPFLLGDHPVVVDNELPPQARRGVGLASPGASIYLPLCPSLCLGMMDGNIVSDLFENAKQSNKTFQTIQADLAITRRQFTPEQQAVFALLRQIHEKPNPNLVAFERGIPAPYDNRVTMRANSMQTIYAGRWIVSSRCDFSLARRMVADDPKLRKAPELEVY
jgi:hypothetical protein